MIDGSLGIAGPASPIQHGPELNDAPQTDGSEKSWLHSAADRVTASILDKLAGLAQEKAADLLAEGATVANPTSYCADGSPQAQEAHDAVAEAAAAWLTASDSAASAADKMREAIAAQQSAQSAKIRSADASRQAAFGDPKSERVAGRAKAQADQAVREANEKMADAALEAARAADDWMKAIDAANKADAAIKAANADCKKSVNVEPAKPPIILDRPNPKTTIPGARPNPTPGIDLLPKPVTPNPALTGFSALGTPSGGFPSWFVVRG